MKYFNRFLVLFVLLSGTMSIAQNLLLEENFNYPSGTLVNTIAGFNARSTGGTYKQTIASIGLSYTGYLSSDIGKSDSLTLDGDDFSRDFATYVSGQTSWPNAITTGSVYFSALVKVLSAGTVGDYFLSFHWNNTFNGKVFVQSNGNGFSFATAKNTVNPYETTVRTYGTTYLVVVKYTFNSGTGDDRIDMWINPDVTSGSEPASVAPFSNITESTRNDYAAIGGVAIRQGGTSPAIPPKVYVDGIRIATDWATLMMGKFTAVKKETGIIPSEFSVDQNYPNPFNPTTVVSYNVPKSGLVNISVYNSLGQKVTSLYEGEVAAGNHRINWNGKNQFGSEVTSGVYFATVNFAGQSKTIKMLLTR